MTNGNEDFEVEGVFIIIASSKDVFLNRLRKLTEVTGFSTGGCDSYKEDYEGGCWKVITMSRFGHINEVKEVIARMKRYNWLSAMNCDLLIDGKEIYSCGKWLNNAALNTTQQQDNG